MREFVSGAKGGLFAQDSFSDSDSRAAHRQQMLGREEVEDFPDCAGSPKDGRGSPVSTYTPELFRGMPLRAYTYSADPVTERRELHGGGLRVHAEVVEASEPTTDVFQELDGMVSRRSEILEKLRRKVSAICHCDGEMKDDFVDVCATVEGYQELDTMLSRH